MVDFIDNRGESPQFQVPTAYNMRDGIATPKAYAGTSGKAAFYFYTIEQINRKKSDELKYEVKDTIEIVEFKNDSKCSAAHPIDASTFQMHPEILADYQRWKQGKESDVTEIRNWDAIGIGEIGMLIASGFYSVEQIVATPDNELMVLGLMWKDIKMKADQHMKKKIRERQGIAEKEELSAMQAELAKRDKELAELRARVEAIETKEEKVILEAVEEVKAEEVVLPDLAIEKPKKGKKKATKKRVVRKRSTGVRISSSPIESDARKGGFKKKKPKKPVTKTVASLEKYLSNMDKWKKEQQHAASQYRKLQVLKKRVANM